jgi:thiamine biosynthesis lipoprotein
VTAAGAASANKRQGPRRVLIPERVALPPSFAALRVLRLEEIGGATMGTTWRAKLAVVPETDLAAVKRAIEAVLQGIIDEMSPWKPESRISRFNAAPAGSWHELPDAFFKVLSSGLEWAERSFGAYDPTLGRSVNLWGFGPEGAQGLPADEAVAEAQATSGWHRLVLDKATRRVLQPGGLALDLSSIAKGFAVDEVARRLRGLGIANFLAEIGGELVGEGFKPDGTPWWVEMEQPRAGTYTLTETRVALAGLAIATSGDEQRFLEVGGRRLAHTLDPRTGAPLTHDLVSVTVLAESCMTADAATTALLVMGPEHGPAFARRGGLAARFVHLLADGLAEEMSPAMAAMLD